VSISLCICLYIYLPNCVSTCLFVCDGQVLVVTDTEILELSVITPLIYIFEMKESNKMQTCLLTHKQTSLIRKSEGREQNLLESLSSSYSTHSQNLLQTLIHTTLRDHKAIDTMYDVLREKGPCQYHFQLLLVSSKHADDKKTQRQWWKTTCDMGFMTMLEED
jgi:hypothetical protein